MQSAHEKENPFAVFGIAPRFDVNLGELEKTHRDLSRAVHPDRAATRSARKDSVDRAMAVNEAWRVIKDPIRRAEALFSLHGIAIGDGAEPKPAPDFLMDMLEQREALADARAEKSVSRVSALADEIRTRETETTAALAAAFADGQSPSGDDATTALRKLGALRFYRRFLEEVNAALDELLEGGAP